MARCSFDVVHAWGMDGLRGWRGLEELIASGLVGGVTHPSSRRRGVEECHVGAGRSLGCEPNEDIQQGLQDWEEVELWEKI